MASLWGGSMRHVMMWGLSICLLAGMAAAGEVTQSEYSQLKKEVEELRQRLSSRAPVGTASATVDQCLDNKYGPNAVVTTRQGKLTIGGLLQVWYYSIQN